MYVTLLGFKRLFYLVWIARIVFKWVTKYMSALNQYKNKPNSINVSNLLLKMRFKQQTMKVWYAAAFWFHQKNENGCVYQITYQVNCVITFKQKLMLRPKSNKGTGQKYFTLELSFSYLKIFRSIIKNKNSYLRNKCQAALFFIHWFSKFQLNLRDTCCHYVYKIDLWRVGSRWNNK